jgi:hypothetical protein
MLDTQRPGYFHQLNEINPYSKNEKGTDRNNFRAHESEA